MKLLERFAEVARLRRLSKNTCDAYSRWIRDFLAFSRGPDGTWRHPAELATPDVEAFLNELVTRRRLSASSQNQALNALVFLYHHILEDAIPRDHLGKFELLRSRRVPRVPTVLSREEVGRIIAVLPIGHNCAEGIAAVSRGHTHPGGTAVSPLLSVPRRGEMGKPRPPRWH